MENDPELLCKYDETFKEQQKFGIMEQVETPRKVWQIHYLRTRLNYVLYLMHLLKPVTLVSMIVF